MRSNFLTSPLSVISFGAVVFSACTSEDPANQVMQGDARGLGDITRSQDLEQQKLEIESAQQTAALASQERTAKLQADSSERIAALQSKAQSENLLSNTESNIEVAKANERARNHEANMQFASTGISVAGQYMSTSMGISSQEKGFASQERIASTQARAQVDGAKVYADQSREERLSNKEERKAQQQENKNQSSALRLISDVKRDLSQRVQPLQDEKKTIDDAMAYRDAKMSGTTIAVSPQARQLANSPISDQELYDRSYAIADGLKSFESDFNQLDSDAMNVRADASNLAGQQEAYDNAQRILKAAPAKADQINQMLGARAPGLGAKVGASLPQVKSVDRPTSPVSTVTEKSTADSHIDFFGQSESGSNDFADGGDGLIKDTVQSFKKTFQAVSEAGSQKEIDNIRKQLENFKGNRAKLQTQLHANYDSAGSTAVSDQIMHQMDNSLNLFEAALANKESLIKESSNLSSNEIKKSLNWNIQDYKSLQAKVGFQVQRMNANSASMDPKKYVDSLNVQQNLQANAGGSSGSNSLMPSGQNASVFTSRGNSLDWLNNEDYGAVGVMKN